MRIALISYEYPPAVAIGGIGTYAGQASTMLTMAGHSVEVFAAGPPQPEPAETLGVRVHRIAVPSRSSFRSALAPCFLERHRQEAFDVWESPELSAEAEPLLKLAPEVARVVKLHTSSHLLAQIGHEPPTWAQHARFSLGALRRGRLAVLPTVRSDQEWERERAFTLQADEVAAPSQAIGDRITADWGLNPAQVAVFPNPFTPAPGLLELPLPEAVGTVGFLGRLETRKGIFEFAEALRPLLRRHPFLNVRFIGPSWPTQRGEAERWLRRYLHHFINRVTFTGGIASSALARELGVCDVVVLPSRWESFGLVCAESMAAGRVVIGSSAGGMAEQIEHGHSGLLVPPRSPGAITAALEALIEQPALVAPMAAAARQRVLTHLAPERILPLQLASYQRAIERARQRQTSLC
ncbi:glycosyltransferase family 4 protein [Cyanobium sp. Morenito 9A2]|uniref:glycosyltransferase family 4 protein n=1 Tax=Cyanobium sp. Morenito 9A2 TaxID=2823718 RepID=UPI0020CBAFF1|nr:glycosyltransferase family 4 protein [Cyanobium sp. Morenito 9A2]MCP9849778.1 glycosyltransferase family 4 protein [Cyanobium sp. Morenito 9A2]